MTKRVVVWGLVLLTVVNLGAIATIGYHRFSHHGARPAENRHEQENFLHRELGLSDTQTAQLKTLREAFQSSIAPIRASLSAQREQLVELLMVAHADRLRIAAVRTEIDSLQAEVQRLVIDHLLAESTILTPEQRSRFFSIIRERLSVEDTFSAPNR